MKTERELLEEISSKLDRIQAILVVQDLEDVADKIRLLRDLEIDNATIAMVTGLSKNAVAIRLTRMKSPRAKK